MFCVGESVSELRHIWASHRFSRLFVEINRNEKTINDKQIVKEINERKRETHQDTMHQPILDRLDQIQDPKDRQIISYKMNRE